MTTGIILFFFLIELFLILLKTKPKVTVPFFTAHSSVLIHLLILRPSHRYSLLT